MPAIASAIRVRSHVASAVGPSCSADAARCSSWPTWRRSVSRRSPSSSASIRADRSSATVIVSSSAATPRVRRMRAQSCRRRWTSSHSQLSSSAPACARRCADHPRKQVSAAEWARVIEAGRSSASIRRSHSRAMSVPNTLPAPLMTAGTPASSSAWRTSAACQLVRTSTARCPGQTTSSSIRARELNSATTSPARSSAMNCCAESFLAKPRGVSARSRLSRIATRKRIGACAGAPVRRDTWCSGAARTCR